MYDAFIVPIYTVRPNDVCILSICTDNSSKHGKIWPVISKISQIWASTLYVVCIHLVIHLKILSILMWILVDIILPSRISLGFKLTYTRDQRKSEIDINNQILAKMCAFFWITNFDQRGSHTRQFILLSMFYTGRTKQISKMFPTQKCFWMFQKYPSFG